MEPGERIRRVLSGAALVTVAVVSLGLRAAADQIPAGWEASNMRPVGYSGLDGRGGAFKMAIRHVNNRWYLYLGHLWHSGWSIVDVTDPANPKVEKFIPGPDNTWTIQIELRQSDLSQIARSIVECATGESLVPPTQPRKPVRRRPKKLSKQPS